MLVLSRADVEAVLDLDRLIDSLQAAMIELSEGRATMPSRAAVMVPDRDGLLAVMPASLPSVRALTTKLVSVFPRNVGEPTHQALICCFDSVTGTPIAAMDGTYVTAARTAAGSALATRLLARRDAAVVSVLGTGVQARMHAVLHARLPSVSSIRIAGRRPDKVSALVAELTGMDIPATAAESIEAAVRSADVVSATTHAASPVIHRDWLRAGTHVNSVGFNITGSGEVDQQTVRDAMVVVESREAALAPPPSGAVEFRQPASDGATPEQLVHAEIGEIAAGTKPGRSDPETITLYKSVGVAVQDAAAAALVLDAAAASGVGTTVDV